MSESWRRFLEDGARRRAEGGLRRRLRTLGAGPRVAVDGRPVVSFASNDYLGLAADPRLAAAADAASREEGTGAGAARLLAGARPAHERLERETAAFKGAEAALLCGSGYALNVSLVPALAGEGDLIVSDGLNHASLVDGCRLSRARVAVVPHGDLDAAAAALGHGGFRRRLLLTEGLFSMDGDVAPLRRWAELAERCDGLLLVDDAHGNGVLGPGGRGAAAAAGLVPGPALLEVGTYGKAFGGYGAFAAWTTAGVEHLLHEVRGFVFSTAPPPGVAAADGEGLRLAAAEPERRERLASLGIRFRTALREAGGPDLPGEGPIVPLPLGDPRTATAVADALLLRGWWAPALRPPTVPAGTSRLRVSLSAAHGEDEVDGLAADLAAVLSETVQT